jgi:hypothetical protein
MDPAPPTTGVTSQVTTGTPGDLTTSVGRQVPMVLTSKEAKGLKSYLFELKDVQEFEVYARFARDQSLAGTLTWNKEVRNSLIEASPRYSLTHPHDTRTSEGRPLMTPSEW